MATIDDIRIKLDVDASQVARGVKQAFTTFDAELRKQRTAAITLSMKEHGSVQAVLKQLKADIAEAGKVAVEVSLANFDAAPIAQQLTDDLKNLPGGGVAVPVTLDTKLTKREMAQTARDLRAAIGVITVDWQLAPQPKGGWPEPPPGWGGSMGGPTTGGGGTGPAPTTGGPAPTEAAPEAAPTGPTGRTAEQVTNDKRLAKARADKKKADLAGDVEARKKAEADVRLATAERDRLAKRRRADETAARRARSDEAKREAEVKRGQTEAQGALPETPAAGIGGSRRGQRAAKAAAAKVPTGDPARPRASGVATQLPDTERQRAFRTSDPLANFVGKGKEEKFRRSTAPRDLMPEAIGLTPQGEQRKALGMPLRSEHFDVVKQGETPETDPVSKWQRILNNLKISRGYREGLESWAAEMQAQGVGGQAGAMSEEDARAIIRTLKPKERERLFTGMGLPTDIDMVAGGAADPLKRPEVVAAFQALLNIPAARFGESVAETAGGNVNINAGARLKDPPKSVKSGGQITGGAVESAQKQMARPLSKRMPREASDKPGPEDALREARRLQEVAERSGDGAAHYVARQALQKARAAQPAVEAGVAAKRMRSGPTPETAARMGELRPDDLSTAGVFQAESQKIAARFEEALTPRQKETSLADLEGTTFGYPEPGRSTPASYTQAFGQAVEARYGRLRRASGKPPLTTAERIAAQKRAEFSAVQRDDLGLRRFTIPGLAEGGDLPQAIDHTRVRHTWKWRQTSLDQRKRQPWCTYCQTMGSAENPLQADHIRDLALGGSPFDRFNITTACKNCNLAKRKKVGWGPPGRAEGGSIWDKGTWADARDQRKAAGLAARDQDRSFGILANPQIAKLKAMADQEASPNEAEIAKRMLRDKGVPGYAEGGDVEKLQRMRLRGTDPFGLWNAGMVYFNPFEDDPSFNARVEDPDTAAADVFDDTIWGKAARDAQAAADGITEASPNTDWQDTYRTLLDALHGAYSDIHGPRRGSRQFLATDHPDWSRHAEGGRIPEGVFRGFKEQGRPGFHVEDSKEGRKYGLRAVVSRDDQGAIQGALMMFAPDARPGRRDYGDVYPYVKPELRGQGIGAALFQHAAKRGFNVEELSDRNAREHGQTFEGHQLWLKRKREQGWTTDEIETWRDRQYRVDAPLKRAEGGQVKHAGTRDRPAGVTMVGERGPELIVNDAAGNAEVIPTHQMATWLARHGMAEGGVVPAAEGRTLGGPFQFGGVTGSLASDASRLSRGTVAGGTITRVFVVNWPASFTGAAGAKPLKVTDTTPTGRVDKLAAASGVQQPRQQRQPRQQPQVVTPPGMTTTQLAGAQPGDFILPSQSPLAQARLAIAQQRQLGVSRLSGQAERADIAVALAESPVRAFTTSVSQVFQTLTGRGQLTRQAKAAQQAVAESQRADLALSNAVKEFQKTRLDRRALVARGDLRTPEQNALLVQANVDFKEQAAAIREYRKEVVRTGAEADKALAPLGGASQALRNLAAGGIASITAGIGFTAAFAALNAAVEIGTTAISEATDRSTGYHNATAALTKTLAEGTRQQKGNAAAATAATLALSGLADETSERFLPALAGRAEGIAGNQALQEQVVQIAAAQNMGINRPQGLPPGFDASLVRSTGGPFDAGLLPGVLSDRATSDVLGNTLNNLVFGTEELKRLHDAQRPFILGGPFGVGIRAGEEFQAPSPDLFNQKLDEWLTTTAERGAKGGALAEFGRETEQERIDATIQAFRNIGANDFADAIQKKVNEGFGIALQGPEISDFIAAQFLDSQRRAALRPSAGNLITQLTAPGPGGLSQLDATLRDIRRQGAVQREALLPAQQALAFAAQPIVPFNDPRLQPKPMRGEQFEDVENTVGQYREAFEKYAKFAVPAQERVNAQITKGQAILRDWGMGPILDDIATLGQNIQDIQLGVQQRSLNLEVSQYNNELRIANRSLQSAKDFAAAIKGNVRDTTGALQGQNFQLGRRLQLLQQELQQRQINLQLAVAGFQVAGETPEERAARQDAAQAEAEFAQKQLNLQKQMSSNEFTIGLKENANAITDLTAQIALLREGKALSIENFAADQAIKAMIAELQVLEAEAQERFDEQVQMSKVELGIIADIERETGEVFDNWRNKLIPAYREAGKAAGKAATDFVVASILTALGQTVTQGTTISPTKIKLIEENQDGGQKNAAGTLFNTTGATSMIVGEAGTETVAVLRNPRQMQMGGGGSGGGVIVHINLNGDIRMRNEADIAILADKIEERLSRRLQMTRR